jgi:hypothetical protein
VHEEVDVVLFSVELLRLGLEVRADLAHDLLTASVNALLPVLGDKTKWTCRLCAT